MKLRLLVASFLAAASALQLRKVELPEHRNLKQGFGFLVSQAGQKNLCITAVEGTKPAGDLELQPCEFGSAPDKQLWKLKNEQLVSALGNGSDYCMIVNHGKAFFDGVRVRLGKCSDPLTDFNWQGRLEFADVIQVIGYETNYCLTFKGTNANPGDKILARPCIERTNFFWKLDTDAPDDEVPFGNLYELYEYNAGGCAQPKVVPATEGSQLIVGDCGDPKLSGWYPKEYNGFVFFHSALDTNFCMQVGLGGIPKDGTWMRLFQCDVSENLQRLSWPDFEAPIQLASRDDLCMVSQGQPEQLGDRLIMKDCNVRTFEWSGDVIE